jgi:DNA-binding transcriptional LysR family regulator
MADLNALAVFAKVVEAGSFSEAARRLKMPVSTVSRRVTELEDQLVVRLIERSTRNLRLTELGAEVLEHAIRSAELSEAVESIVSNRLADVSGTLRLSSMPSVSDTLTTPLVTAFQASYPNVRVQILVTERMVDLIADGIDLAFRLGPLRDSNSLSESADLRVDSLTWVAGVSAFGSRASLSCGMELPLRVEFTRHRGTTGICAELPARQT